MFKGQNLLSTLKNIDPAFNVVANNALGSNPNALPEINIRGNSSLPMSMDELNNQTAQKLNQPRDTPVGAIREIIRSIPYKAGMVADRRRLQCAQVAQVMRDCIGFR